MASDDKGQAKVKVKAPRGRPEDRVVIEGDWRDAMAKALHKRAAAPTPKGKKRKLK